MIWRYGDATRDAGAYADAQEAAAIRWEEENYRGKCPICGKDMYTNISPWLHGDELAEENDDFEGGYVHVWCRRELEDAEEEAREAFDEMMGDPIKALEGLTA